ncbi:MAG: DNA adenine methylase [Geothrix sp.]|nr:DNA adenine methylase [Geothrix sp.]
MREPFCTGHPSDGAYAEHRAQTIPFVSDHAYTPLMSIAVPKPLAGVPHPIPYQGSKRQLAHYIVSLFPVGTKRLVEPFAGSAAVSLAAGHMKRVGHWTINDLHRPLMDLWTEIVRNPDEISDKYESLWKAQLGDERAYYDRVRDRFNAHHHPEDFLYLLARCVKAAVRYNTRGEFNNSPDNRRLGAVPDTMRRHIMGASALLKGKSSLLSVDYREVLGSAKPGDLVYMDPPYQGVVDTQNHRYRHGVSFDDFVAALDGLRRKGIAFIVSYDGRTGTKRYGRSLPASLGLTHVEIPAGRSTQATLLGRDDSTFESLYLSPEINVGEARILVRRLISLSTISDATMKPCLTLSN